MTLTNERGATAAIDAIGGSSGNELALCVQPHGNFITIGLLSGEQVNWKVIVNQMKVKANLFHLRHWNKSVSIAKWQETFQHLIMLIIKKKLELMKADKTYDLIEIKKAMSTVESSSKKNNGKIFLTSY
jgi:NADPH2:quinone reductase